jgi:mxaK protein
MRRRQAHAIFAGFLLACAALAAVQGLRLVRAERINGAISRIQAGDAVAARADDAQVQFALAVKLAASDRYEEALKAYKTLVNGDRTELKAAALYDLGNLHLREAMRRGTGDKVQSLALIELAKQSYRDLLRLDPNDWDARYNLERALWLAPELDEAAEELASPLPSERAVTTMKSEGGALP